MGEQIQKWRQKETTAVDTGENKGGDVEHTGRGILEEPTNTLGQGQGIIRTGIKVRALD